MKFSINSPTVVLTKKAQAVIDSLMENLMIHRHSIDNDNDYMCIYSAKLAIEVIGDTKTACSLQELLDLFCQTEKEISEIIINE